MSEANRPGIVLAAVIMIMAVLELLAVCTVAIALQSSALARARAETVRAEQAARGAVLNTVAEWQSRGYQRLSPGSRELTQRTRGENTNTSTRVERLAGDLFLIGASSTLALQGRTLSRAHAAFLLGATDVGAIAEALPAALLLSGVLVLTGSSAADGSAADEIPAGWPAAECTTWLTGTGPKAGVLASDDATVATAPGSTVTGSPPVERQPPGGGAAVGTARVGALAALADRFEGGVVSLGPVSSDGKCDRGAAGNWGAPREPAHPCAGHFPVIYAAGDLAVAQGTGQGVLIVDGDLVLSDGVEFHGIVLVRGRLLARGATISGALLLEGGGTSQLHDSVIRACRCAIARALVAAPALNRPILRQHRSWLPPF